MYIISTRDFRDNQTKYLGLVNSGKDVILKSRAGNFRIIPLSEDDLIMQANKLSKKELQDIREGIESAKLNDTTTISDINNIWENIL